MNRISLDRRIQAINCLVEGDSVRSTERLTGVHRAQEEAPPIRRATRTAAERRRRRAPAIQPAA